MERLNIYPEKDEAYNKELERFQKSTISDKNKALITSYINYLFSKGVKELRASKVSSQLRRICDLLKKDLDITTKDDMIGLVAQINRDEFFSEETKADYRKRIKEFYQWLKTDDTRLDTEGKIKETNKIYDYIKSIKSTCKLKSLDYSEIINEDQIDLIVNKGCRTYKEKALVKVLHETGLRAGELLNLRIKDIEFNDTHCMLRVDGKTGERRVFVIHAMIYLTRWLELHPYKSNSDSFVWLGENRGKMYQPILHKGAQKLLDRVFEHADMAKIRHNLHWFRHSRATLLAPKVTEVILCDYMGWVRGSKQVRRYVHLCAKQVENAFLELNGLAKKQDTQRQPQKCACGTLNDTGQTYCHKCGKPLRLEDVLMKEKTKKEEMDKTLDLMMEIARNPDLMARFETFTKTHKM